MDVFQGNSKLEEVIFTGLDYALWSRSDINDTFMPFMMLHKDGKSKLIRVAAQGDPNNAFIEVLEKDKEQYDQIVMCFEGRIPFEGTKHDAVIVKGFDTSQENGLMFIQRFRGIESGKPFSKFGNPTLVSKDEKLPVQSVARETNKKIENPYISGLLIKDEKGQSMREIIAGHDNPSILSNHIFDAVLNTLNVNEAEFSGKFMISFVQGTIKHNAFSKFIFDQLVNDLKINPFILQWQERFKRHVTIDLKFNEAENKGDSNKQKNESQEKNTVETIKKPWWKRKKKN